MKETHDESNPREPTNDIPNGGHSKRPSVTKFPVGQSPENEQSLAKKARKSRNSWSFRSQYHSSLGLLMSDISRVASGRRR